MAANDFAVFILTHDRVDRMVTYRTLKRQGYTGRIVVMVDDEDPALAEYQDRYGDEVRVFSKRDVGSRTDLMDTGGSEGVVVFARNAAIEAAREMGLNWLLQLDDDYSSFQHRWISRDGRAPVKEVADLDAAFDATLDFLRTSGLDVVAWAQGGDLVGGGGGTRLQRHVGRKAMNVLFLSADTDLRFRGRLNEDVNLYTGEGQRGRTFLTLYRIMVVQGRTQANEGGMTEAYLDGGTYAKSYYSVVAAPSAVSVRWSVGVGGRMHHHVDWNAVAPKILSGDYRRES